MKKRKIVLATVLFITNSLCFAQFVNCKLAEIEKLKQTGNLTVAISDDDETNKEVDDVMKTYWTASKYTIIKQSELEEFVKTNPENYVLTYLVSNSVRLFTRGSQTQTASTANASLSTTRSVGDGIILTKNLKKIKKFKPTDAMIYGFIDSDLDKTNSKAEFIRQIGTINAIFMFPDLKENQIGGWKVPTLNQKELIKKELWIADVDLNKKGMVEAKMKAAYNPYKYKIVTKEEMAAAIIEKKKGVVYAAKIVDQVINGTEAHSFMMHNAEDNRLLFFVPESMTGGFGTQQLDLIKANKVHGN